MQVGERGDVVLNNATMKKININFEPSTALGRNVAKMFCYIFRAVSVALRGKFCKVLSRVVKRGILI